MGLAEGREIDALGQVLAEQAVGILVGSALPRALGIAEVDLGIGGKGEASMIGEFLAPVPGQRAAEIAG